MGECPFSTRRGFLGAASVAGGAVAAAAIGGSVPANALGGNPAARATAKSSSTDGREPFFGAHQGGIDTQQQTHTVFAVFDLTTNDRAQIVAMLKRWTDASDRMTAGVTAEPLTNAPAQAPLDSGEVLGLAPRRLTLTFGFAPGVFEREGKDRYGLLSRRPAALVDLPTFNGDQIDPAKNGGDVCVQACADDPQIAFHAIRQLARLAAPTDAGNGYASGSAARGGYGADKSASKDALPPTGTAVLRWMQAGFLPDSASGDSPRNLLGFRDGTQNPGDPSVAERADKKSIGNGTLDEAVWVGNEGPAWMRGGTYMVVRRVRLVLEHWDRSELDFQEQVIGRRKATGAPLTGGNANSPLDLDAADKDGNPVIAENAHVRLGSASANGGARMLRRSYSYNDGLSMVAERWPPWRQGLEYDAGLLFVAHQRDPRTGFVKIFENMAKFDLLNQYATHVGSGIFACPKGVRKGSFIGAELFA